MTTEGSCEQPVVQEKAVVQEETLSVLVWWKRPETWSLAARLAMAGLGTAAVVIGLLAAAQAHASTTALIVGAVLIALAILFKPDLEEITGEYGGAKIRYRRSAGIDSAAMLGELTQALEVAQSAQGENLERAVEQIKTQAAEATKRAYREAIEEQGRGRDRRNALVHALTRRTAPAPSTFWESVTPSPYTTGTVSPLAGLMLRPTPKHVVGDDQVFLALDNAPFSSACVVKTPRDEEHITLRFAFGTALAMASATYPRDFPNAGPLEPGEYEVDWRDLQSVFADGRVQWKLGVTTARDSFEFPAPPPKTA